MLENVILPSNTDVQKITWSCLELQRIFLDHFETEISEVFGPVEGHITNDMQYIVLCVCVLYIDRYLSLY